MKKVIYASGYTKPLHYVLIKAEVSGYIRNIYVKEGEEVKKGAILAEIEPRGVPAQLAEIDRKLALVEARLHPNSDYLQSLRRDIEIAKSNYLNEEKKWQRRVDLFKEGLISKEDLENAQISYKTAKETYEKLKNQYEDTLKALQTEKKVLQEQRRILTSELSKYFVRAPESGVILKKYVEIGDFVNPFLNENKLFSLGSREMEVILEVDEEYAGLVKIGQRAFLSFDSYPDTLFEGEVYQIIREIDRSKRSFPVKVKLKEAPLLPAQTTVEANILLEEKRGLVIPLKALREENFVEVKGRGKVKIEKGERFGEFVEVLSGLRKGEEVKVYK